MLRRAGVSSSLLWRPSMGCIAARRTLHASVAVRGEHGAPSTHKDTEDNNANTPFDFTPENYARIDEILSRFPKTNALSAVIPLLDLAQRQNNNWLPVAAMNKVAKILKTSPMNVYEVATFYTMFNRQPVGKHFLQLCTTTPCMYGGCGSKLVQETIEKHLGIHAGETTPDGLFTLVEVECLGACVNAPMLQLNDDFYEDLDPATTIKLLDDLRAGRPVTPGPQSGKRRNAIGPQGRTTLLEKPTGPFAPYLDKPVEKPADAKKN